ncbi:MAG: hypothetical protein WD176_05950 [Pirellulales bacterium]
MSEALQEFVDSRNQRLRVDRAAGVIRGVKLLGLSSRNGRRYRENALVEAVGLYEGAKVNINHPKGHPLSPRDYQDRLGEIRGVQFRAGEGLFGDLHFNPKHALSEQLMWDAEHAPQNVGLSHNVLARTTREGNGTAVEAIAKVQSIDLVADPATTAGLFEHAVRDDRDASEWNRLTLEELQLHRPDLVRELRLGQELQLEELRERFDQLAAREATAKRRERVLELIREHDLPLPTSDGKSDGLLVSQQFIETLMRAADDEGVRRLVEERAELIRSASRWANGRARNDRPRSRDQVVTSGVGDGSRPCNGEEFATAIRKQ